MTTSIEQTPPLKEIRQCVITASKAHITNSVKHISNSLLFMGSRILQFFKFLGCSLKKASQVDS